mgnify:FL=1
MIELVVAFCIVSEINPTVKPPHLGTKAICGTYEPKVKFKDKKECEMDKKLIEVWFVEQSRRLHPFAREIQVMGVCVDSV